MEVQNPKIVHWPRECSAADCPAAILPLSLEDSRARFEGEGIEMSPVQRLGLMLSYTAMLIGQLCFGPASVVCTVAEGSNFGGSRVLKDGAARERGEER